MGSTSLTTSKWHFDKWNQEIKSSLLSLPIKCIVYIKPWFDDIFWSLYSIKLHYSQSMLVLNAIEQKNINAIPSYIILNPCCSTEIKLFVSSWTIDLCIIASILAACSLGLLSASYDSSILSILTNELRFWLDEFTTIIPRYLTRIGSTWDWKTWTKYKEKSIKIKGISLCT